MCDKSEFEICRLCLNSRGILINVFGDNSKLHFMLDKTIEELIDVEVVQNETYPWLVCSSCMQQLTEFRLFKRRCTECLSVFYNRIQNRCNPATEDCRTNREKFPVEIKELHGGPIVSDDVDQTAVDVPEDKIKIKEEIETASECSDSPVNDIESLMIASMQEGCSHWSGNEKEKNLEESDDDIPEEGDLEVDLSREQDDGPRQESAGKGSRGGQDVAKNLIHKCQTCNKVFKEKELFKAHVMNTHLENEKEFVCDICSVVYEYESDLIEHVKSVHTIRKKYQCQLCTRRFQKLSQMKTHMFTHTSEKPFKCEMCPKSFTDRANLRRHILSHTGERPYACEICPQAFSRKSHLTRHVLKHTGSRLYKCDICHREFTQSGDLRIHMSTHTDDKSFRCEVCTKEFSCKDALNRHTLIHTGEKSFKCSICSRAFTKKGTLKRHMLIHTGEKSYTCHICARAFNRNENLQSHILTHTGERPYKCDLCSKAFTQHSSLRKHIMTHSNEKSY